MLQDKNSPLERRVAGPFLCPLAGGVKTKFGFWIILDKWGCKCAESIAWKVSHLGWVNDIKNKVYWLFLRKQHKQQPSLVWCRILQPKITKFKQQQHILGLVFKDVGYAFKNMLSQFECVLVEILSLRAAWLALRLKVGWRPTRPQTQAGQRACFCSPLHIANSSCHTEGQ